MSIARLEDCATLLSTIHTDASQPFQPQLSIPRTHSVRSLPSNDSHTSLHKPYPKPATRSELAFHHATGIGVHYIALRSPSLLVSPLTQRHSRPPRHTRLPTHGKLTNSCPPSKPFPPPAATASPGVTSSRNHWPGPTRTSTVRVTSQK